MKIRRQPPVDGVNVGLFVWEGVGTLTCLPSKFERDRQPREITYIEVWVFQQQRIKFNKLTACDRLLGLLRDGAAREEGCWGRNRLKFLIRNTGDKSLKGRWAEDGICIWGNAPFAATMFPSFICCNVVWVRRFNNVVDNSWAIRDNNRFGSRSGCRLRTVASVCLFWRRLGSIWAPSVVRWIHVSTNPGRGLHWSGQSIPFVLTLLLELAAIE